MGAQNAPPKWGAGGRQKMLRYLQTNPLPGHEMPDSSWGALIEAIRWRTAAKAVDAGREITKPSGFLLHPKYCTSGWRSYP